MNNLSLFSDKAFNDYVTFIVLRRSISNSYVGTRGKKPIGHVYVITCCLTHWGRMAHICVVELTIIGSHNGLSPGRRQAIIWTNTGILSIRPLGTNFSEILIEIYTFSFKKIHLKMSSGKYRPFCLGLNVLMLSSLMFRITEFREKPSPDLVSSRLASVVFYCFRKQTLGVLGQFLGNNPEPAQRNFGQFMVNVNVGV